MTLYAHFKRFPEFAKRIEALRNTPTMNSKRIFCEAIEDGDVKAAEYWLSRHETARDEYATKSITEGTSVVSVSTDLTDAARKALAMMDA